MSQSDRAKEKAARFPRELQPHPGYEYELPREEPDGTVSIDAGALEWADAIAAAGAKRGFPRDRR